MVMAADRPYGDFYYFYSVSAEFFLDIPPYVRAASCVKATHSWNYAQKVETVVGYTAT
jgi:hypothetical protein